MLNFAFFNPTKILFGKGQIAGLDKEIPAQARVLMTYGGGSIKANGTYDEVKAALGGRTVVEFGGIEPNPTYETLMKAVELGRAERVDFLLAVGGGSVIDGTKFIAAAIPFAGEPWDIVAKRAKLDRILPLGSVLTLPATGSEMNNGGVITNKGLHAKLPFFHPALFPKVSVLDPVKTFSLPPRQVANGVVDAFVHVVEQYLTYPVDAPLQDRFAESLLLTLVEEGPKTLAAPEDYDARANLMWCATLALNGLIAAGVPQDWTTHMIGHELTEMFGIDHARTLAVILPGTLSVLRGPKRAKLVQYGRRVWGLDGDEETIIEQAIARTKSFFESLGVPTHLADHGIDRDKIPAVVDQLRAHGMVKLGENRAVTPEIATEILRAVA